MTEEWRDIASCPGYQVSSLGRVRRIAIIRGGGGSTRYPAECLSTRPLPQGHLQVTVSIGNRPKTHLVHRLVAEAFLPPPGVGQDCVCHRDDDPSNNKPMNLFWGTRGDNSADKVSKGRQAKGEQLPSKLTVGSVKEIRARAANGASQYDLAAEFGVSQSNISMVITRTTWRHV